MQMHYTAVGVNSCCSLARTECVIPYIKCFHNMIYMEMFFIIFTNIPYIGYGEILLSFDQFYYSTATFEKIV